MNRRHLSDLRVPRPRPSASRLQHLAVSARPRARGTVTHSRTKRFGGVGPSPLAQTMRGWLGPGSSSRGPAVEERRQTAGLCRPWGETGPGRDRAPSWALRRQARCGHAGRCVECTQPAVQVPGPGDSAWPPCSQRQWSERPVRRRERPGLALEARRAQGMRPSVGAVPGVALGAPLGGDTGLTLKWGPRPWRRPGRVGGGRGGPGRQVWLACPVQVNEGSFPVGLGPSRWSVAGVARPWGRISPCRLEAPPAWGSGT